LCRRVAAQYPFTVVGGAPFVAILLSMVPPEPPPLELLPPPQPDRVISNAVNSASSMVDGALFNLFIVTNLEIVGQ